jgi:hypothetical protein
MQGSLSRSFSMTWGAMLTPPEVTMRSFLQKTVLVEPPDVSGAEPAVRAEHLCAFGGLAPVAGGHVGAAGEDLAIGRELERDAGHHAADGTEPKGVDPVLGRSS